MHITITTHDDPKLVGECRFAGTRCRVAGSIPGGSYRFERAVSLEGVEQVAAFGPALLYFRDGTRLVALHGGSTDERGSLYPGDGTLRIDNAHLDDLARLVAAAVERGETVTLQVGVERLGFFRSFSHPKASRSVSPYSVGAYRGFDPAEALYWLWLYDTLVAEEAVQEFAATEQFQGGGGEFGGAGASGDYGQFADQAPTDGMPVLAEPFAEQQVVAEPQVGGVPGIVTAAALAAGAQEQWAQDPVAPGEPGDTVAGAGAVIEETQWAQPAGPEESVGQSAGDDYGPGVAY